MKMPLMINDYFKSFFSCIITILDTFSILIISGGILQSEDSVSNTEIMYQVQQLLDTTSVINTCP